MSSSRLRGVFALTSLVSVVFTGCAAETAEDPDDGIAESEEHLLAGRRLSPSEVAGHLRTAGFAEANVGTMVCAAKYESSFYERASNTNRSGSIDRGLFQINSIHLGEVNGCPSIGNAESLYNPATNAKCALAIFNLQGFKAWYGYQKHKSECDSYPAPRSADAAPNNNDDAGGCWSRTLQDMVGPRTCVQSNANNVWMQCMEGKWYRGGNMASGPYGACEGAHPL